MSKQKDVLLRLAHDVSTSRVVDIERAFTADFVLHDPSVGAQWRGHDGARRMMEGVLSFAPDLRMDAVDMIEEGDRVAVRWSVHGTRDGETLVASLVAIYRFVDGRIAEDWGVSVRKAWP